MPGTGLDFFEGSSFMIFYICTTTLLLLNYSNKSDNSRSFAAQLF